MGGGNHRYRCRHDWGVLPAGIVWGKTHAVVVDALSRVHIAHTSCPAARIKDTVVVLDRDGVYQYSWGAEHYGHAHGLTLAREPSGREVLYLTNDERGVFKTTLAGELIQHIGKPPHYDREGLTFGPANVAVDPGGDLFLADGYGSAEILRFEPHGRLVHRFGGTGDEPRHTRWAHGLHLARVDGVDLLHVAVDGPSAIKRFTPDGRYHSELGGTWLHPRNIIARPDGRLWAVPEMQGRLTLLDPATGRAVHLGHWGRSMEEIFHLRTLGRETFPAGAFVSAHGAAFLPGGDIVVTEWVEIGRVTRLEMT